MRLRFRLFIVALVTGLLFAGCTDAPRNDASDEGPSGGDDADGGGDGNAPKNGDGSSGPDEPATRGPPPKDQEVDDADDVDEPGEYAILPRAQNAKDESWSVPGWTAGDTWLWEHHFPASPQTRTQTQDEVTGTGMTWDVDVYRVTRTQLDEEGETRQTERLNHTASSLTEVEDDGYIEHVFLFPLTDGKRWVYARDSHDGITKVTAEARHESAYQWNGRIIEAWSVVLEFEGDDGIEMRHWLGVEQKNFVHREFWADQDGVPTLFWSTTLKSHTSG